jgi:hypothetical protein
MPCVFSPRLKFVSGSPGRARLETQKAARSPWGGKRQLQRPCETTTLNPIDMLRDGTSFPESCGEESHIGGVSGRVNPTRKFDPSMMGTGLPQFGADHGPNPGFPSL